MFTCGLCSVTFRSFGVPDVIAAVKKSGLSAIEFGGDVHVKDSTQASSALKLSRDAGITPCSYGSYFRLDGDFTPTLDTASALCVQTVRIWAGTCGSDKAASADRERFYSAASDAVTEAAAKKITVAAEWHGGTLTDTQSSALDFAKNTGAGLYWQPNQWRSEDENAAELKAMLPYLCNVHVFAWRGNGKFPLSAQRREWTRYLEIIAGGGKNPTLLMEFLPRECEDDLMRDAAELLDICQSLT